MTSYNWKHFYLNLVWPSFLTRKLANRLEQWSSTQMILFSRDVGQCHSRGVAPGISWVEAQVLLHTLQCPGQQGTIWSKLPVMLRLRNCGLEEPQAFFTIVVLDVTCYVSLYRHSSYTVYCSVTVFIGKSKSWTTYYLLFFTKTKLQWLEGAFHFWSSLRLMSALRNPAQEYKGKKIWLHLCKTHTSVITGQETTVSADPGPPAS